jgi:hypothetical protein
MVDPDDSATQPYDDPGWFPGANRSASGPSGGTGPSGTDGLVILRILFLSLLAAPFFILAILTFVIDEVGSPEPLLGTGIAGLALAGVAAAAWASRRPLDITSAESLAQSYRTSFFLGFALNETPLLIGFAFCYIEEAMWPYLVAFPIYLVGMWLLAPRRRNLERRQEQIYRQGSMLSLGRAISSMPQS